MEMFEALFSPLLEQPLLIFLGVFLLVVFLLKEWSRATPKKRKGRWKGRTAKASPDWARRSSSADFAANQLKTVSCANFTSRSLLNKPEAKVFKALDEAVIARNPRWQVMAQVSLGEFLASPNKDAFAAINSKRVDFALMDENARVIHALEYQGTGHHTGTSAAARDAIKKEALRKAGIGYHEIVAGHTTPSELRALVEKLVPAH